MANETTPSVITDEIKQLCATICPEAKPFYVDASPFDGMQPNECFKNVDTVMQKLDGERITGWAIWQWANILVEAEAHAIWKAPDGQLIDVSPHISAEEHILFLPDDRVQFNGNPIPSHRQALTNSPLVAELIALSDKKDTIAAASSGQTYAMDTADVRRMAELIFQFHRSAERNEPCPCGSGLKYKKCCGRYR